MQIDLTPLELSVGSGHPNCRKSSSPEKKLGAPVGRRGDEIWEEATKIHCRVLLTQCPSEWGTVSQAIITVGSAMVLEIKPLCHLGLSFDH